jgi:hypothetical protein
MNNTEKSQLLFSMDIEGQQHWLPLFDAGIAYNSGMARVAIGGFVLDTAGPTRPITDEERHLIAEIADSWSENQ